MACREAVERAGLLDDAKRQYGAPATAAGLNLKRVACPQTLQNVSEKVEELEQKLKDLKQVTILIIGKSDVGKSSLINAIFPEAKAAVGYGAGPTTENMMGYSCCMADGTEIRIFDSRGLYRKNSSKEYISSIRLKCEEADIIFFCVNMNASLAFEDCSALRYLMQAYSQLMFKKAIIVLTKANLVKSTSQEQSREDYFRVVLTMKVAEITGAIKEIKPDFDESMLQIAIAGSPGSHGKEKIQDDKSTLPKTSEIGKIKILNNLKDYKYPSEWVPIFFVTCMMSEASENAKLALMKIHTKWKLLTAMSVVSGAQSTAEIGAGITLCVIGASATPIPIAGPVLAATLVTIGGILIALGAERAGVSVATATTAHIEHNREKSLNDYDLDVNNK